LSRPLLMCWLVLLDCVGEDTNYGCCRYHKKVKSQPAVHFKLCYSFHDITSCIFYGLSEVSRCRQYDDTRYHYIKSQSCKYDYLILCVHVLYLLLVFSLLPLTCFPLYRVEIKPELKKGFIMR